MPRTEDRVRMQHMLEAAEKALLLADGRNRADLDEDDMFPLAVVRLLEIVGEAAKAVSIDTRAESDRIPWKMISSTRDRLIHGYHDVDMDVVWSILVCDLAPLAAELRAALDGWQISRTED